MRIDFLATIDDLSTALGDAERELGGLCYLELGTKREPSFARFDSFKDLPDLGRSQATGAGMGNAFEICMGRVSVSQPLARETGTGTGVFVSSFPHVSGSLFFAPSFRYSGDPRKIVPGVVADDGTDASKTFFKLFKKHFFKGFRKEWVWQIGPRAHQAACAGEVTLVAMDVNERPDQNVKLTAR